MRITGQFDTRHIALHRLALRALPPAAAGSVEHVLPVPAVAPQPQAQTSVAMLVAIAASDPEARRRRNTAAADKGLQALERLYDELSIGPPSPPRLRAIAVWMNDHCMPEDPAAADLLREVELRVLVELAKAERDA